MDAQRCQNHGPVRLLVPLLEFNLSGNVTTCIPAQVALLRLLQMRNHPELLKHP